MAQIVAPVRSSQALNSSKGIQGLGWQPPKVSLAQLAASNNRKLGGFSIVAQASRSSHSARSRARRDRNQRPAGVKERKEPFDAELTVLFGLPTLVLLIPWLAQEPSGLALVAPLLLFVPGPRGIIRTLFADLFVGISEAKTFITEPGTVHQGSPPPPPPRWPYAATQQKPYEKQQIEADAMWDIPAPVSLSPANKSSLDVLMPNDGQRIKSTARTDNFYQSTDLKILSIEQQKLQRGTSSHVILKGASASRLVRNAGKGKVGIDVESQGARPAWASVVCTVFPFLRSWGGFI